MAALATTVRAFDRSIRYYLFTSLLLGLGVDGVFAVLLNLYLLRLGYSTEFIGIVNAAGLFSFALASFPAGLLGSRFGSRKMLISGVFLVIVGGTAVPLAEFGPAMLQDPFIAIAYVIMMAGFSSFFVNGSPFMMGSISSGKRSTLFAVQTAIGSFAAFGGSLLGGILPEMIVSVTDLSLTTAAPFRLPMQWLMLLMLPAVVLVYSTKEPAKIDSATERAAIKARRKAANEQKRFLGLPPSLPILLIVIIAFIRLMQVAGLGAVSTFFNVYLDTQLNVSPGRIGLLTSMSRLIGVPAALLVPVITKRWGNISIAIVGTFLSALFLLPVAYIPHWLAAGIGFIGSRMMTTIRYPSFQVYVLELFETRFQGVMSGVMASAAGLSFAVMALSGGFIVALFSFRDLFAIGALITAVGGVLTGVVHLVYVRRRPAVDEDALLKKAAAAD